MAKRIDPNAVQAVIGCGYPPPFAGPCANRIRQRLGDEAGLSDFGVNLMRLPPGTWSSQRHWHTHEDEFVFILQGEVVLVTDSGEETLRAGECAGFKAGMSDGHHLQNRSASDALLLEIGSRRQGEDETDYPDIDMKLTSNGQLIHRDGQPYLKSKP